MKKNWKNNFVKNLQMRFSVLSTFVLLILAACAGKEASHEHDTYVCPMHPAVVSDRPGTCPVCGMDLVKKAKPGQEVEITEDLSRLLKSPNETVVASIKTIKGEFKKMPVTIEALGVVTYDTRNIRSIASRMGGRLEKVFLKYTFQQVEKGQKIAEIYSPELVTAQRELLFLVEMDESNTELIQRSKERLSFLGMSDTQITELISRKEPKNTFTIYSPYAGYIVSNAQQVPQAPVTTAASLPANGMRDGMGGNTTSASSGISSPPAVDDGELIREGNYVTSGQTLFNVVSAASLRVELNVSSALTGFISQGEKVQLDFEDGHQQSATIDFIQPFYDEGQEFYKMRVYTDHTDNLHIGHLVKAIIAHTSAETMWVPREAVLDLGVDHVIFVQSKGAFKARKVVTGIRTGAVVEIKEGLSTSDEIAATAQYLIDSESFIKMQK